MLLPPQRVCDALRASFYDDLIEKAVRIAKLANNTRTDGGRWDAENVLIVALHRGLDEMQRRYESMVAAKRAEAV